MTRRLPAGRAWKLHFALLLPPKRVEQVSSEIWKPSIIARGLGLLWPSSGFVTLTLPPAARLTVGVPAMLTLGVFATFTLGVLVTLTFGVLPTFTVPATLVVPCGAVGTGCAGVFVTRTSFCPTAGRAISTKPANTDTDTANIHFDL